jgi:hypothetical protein
VSRSDYRIRRGLLLRNTPRKERHAFAIHEAGHAVASERMGERTLRLWLVPHRRGHGLVGGFTETLYTKRAGRYDPITRAVIALAGHEAERIAFNRPRHLLPWGDFHAVRRLGCSMISINVAGQHARRLVRKEMCAIRRVARALAERGELSRRQFLRAYRSDT